MFKFIAIASVVFLFSMPALSEQKKQEPNFFEEAVHYTVKVKVRVKYPFIKDKRGSFRGAGFLIDKKLGWIVTNAHVSSRNPESLEVSFKGEAFTDAKLVYLDHLLDFAIVQVPSKKIPNNGVAAKLDCTNKPIIGSPAGAFGHPFGLNYSGTRGIISGEKFKWGRLWVQTDAPINSGNSGGPLISLTSGKVVGISSASFSKRRSEGLGFAVPMTHACRIINFLKRGLDPTPSLIPVGFAYDQEKDDELIVAKAYKKLPVSWPLKAGDRIVSLSSKPEEKFKNQAELVHALRGVSGEVKIIVQRDNKKITVPVMIQPRKNLIKRVGLHFSGVVISYDTFKDDEEMNPQGFPLIEDVARASIASSAGMYVEKVIVSVDGKPTPPLQALCSYLKDAEKQKRKVQFLAKEFDWSYLSRTEFTAHKMRIKDVRRVGPQVKKGC